MRVTENGICWKIEESHNDVGMVNRNQSETAVEHCADLNDKSYLAYESSTPIR